MADSLGRFTETFACAFQISLKEMIWMAAPKAAKWEPSSPGASQPRHCALPGPEGQSVSWAFWTEEAVFINTPLKLCYGSPVPATLEQF